MSHPAASNGGFRPQELTRKRFQETVAVTVDRQAKAIQQTREFMADLSVGLEEAKQTLAVARQELKMLREHYIEFQRVQRTFWGRLKWLCTGR